jgi:hypothetical protein
VRGENMPDAPKRPLYYVSHTLKDSIIKEIQYEEQYAAAEAGF